MSHDATNWAIKQRGLKPATKLVLWHLCDRYNPDYGCFPEQESLSRDCEMSRSAVNEHLKALEKAGLIHRERRYNKNTHKRMSTRYRFPFEDDFPCPESGHGAMSGNGAKPCPENGKSHVRNPDINPVREPVIEPVTEREARERADNPDLENPVADTPVERKLSGRERGDLIDRGVADWPKGTGRTDRGIAELKKLSDADLVKAVSRIPTWLALWKANGRSKPHALSTYAGSRLFDDVEEQPPLPPTTTAYAKPGGKLWNSRLYQILFGPMADLPEAPTDYLRVQLAEGGPAGDRARRRHQARYGWPEATEMVRAAEGGRGWSVPLALERVAERCQSVAVDSDLFRAWRSEHERRGWPFLDRRDAHVWLPAPIGSTAGMSPAEIVDAALAAFQAGLAAIENEETTG